MERYSLSDEDVEFLKTSHEESLSVFLKATRTRLCRGGEGCHRRRWRSCSNEVDVNETGGQTPLMVAADAGDEAMVRTSSQRADVDAMILGTVLLLAA
jgi:hypothetical protein